MGSLWGALGVPSTRLPIDATSFVSFILPTLICYLALAVLVLMPRTRVVRVASWPILALLALRAAVSVDMSNGKPGLKTANGALACAMFNITARALDWTLAKEPLVRHLRPGPPSIIFDAFDLAINFRGYGWNWSHGFSFPRDTRPKNRITFALRASIATFAHVLVTGICQQAILSFRPPGHTTPGFSLFDETLPISVRYLRAGIIGFIPYIVSYSVSQAVYNMSALIGVLVVGQEPAQWPPAFDAPWRATSVSEFWGRRWHQWFRHIFVFLGGRLFQSYLGRAGFVFGGFLASAVMHTLLVVGFGPKEDGRLTFLVFIVMGMVALAERAFYRWTGHKVCGLVGRIWMTMWLVLAGVMMFDASAKAGGFGDTSIIDGVRPLRMLVEGLVESLDAYLHAY